MLKVVLSLAALDLWHYVPRSSQIGAFSPSQPGRPHLTLFNCVLAVVVVSNIKSDADTIF